MKSAPCLLLVVLALASQSLKVYAQSNPNNSTLYDLPPFSMSLMIDESNVDPEPFHWPLLAATSTHLSSYIKTDQGMDSLTKISLDISLQVDEDATAALATGTSLKAIFVGNAYFNTTIQTSSSVTQKGVNAMVREAFQGTKFWELVVAFNDDETLHGIKDVHVLVANDAPEGGSPFSGSTPQSGNSSLPPLTIAGLTILLVLVVASSVGFLITVHVRLRRDSRDDGQHEVEQSKSSCSTECDGLSDEEAKAQDTVFSKEYWMDAWSKTASQVAPRPPPSELKRRKVVRQPSATAPSLQAIQETEEEWDDLSFASSTAPVQSMSVWMAPSSLSPESFKDEGSPANSKSLVSSFPKDPLSMGSAAASRPIGNVEMNTFHSMTGTGMDQNRPGLSTTGNDIIIHQRTGETEQVPILVLL